MPLEYGSELLGRDPECASVGIRSAVKSRVINQYNDYLCHGRGFPFFFFRRVFG